MANFKISIPKVLKYEGGYVNDPNDNGGETYKGISRKFWPKWEGWVIIDKYKKSKVNFPKILDSDTKLQDLILTFYKTNFWDKIGGDKINSQSIADLMFDGAVNEGISPVIKRSEANVGLNGTGKVSDELIKRLNSLK
jgi:lysozyme family protein